MGMMNISKSAEVIAVRVFSQAQQGTQASQ